LTLVLCLGCSSDSTAPPDDLQLTAKEAARQAAGLANLLVRAMQGFYVLLDSKDAHIIGIDEGNVLGTLTVAPYDNTAGSENGTVAGEGRLVAGAYTAHFTVDGLALNRAAYPPAGTLTYEVGSPAVVVDFTGGQYARPTVGLDDYQVDLDTGELIED
jgi:hypothetical protein